MKRILLLTAILAGSLLTCFPCAGNNSEARDNDARILKNNRKTIRVEANGISPNVNMAVTMAQTNGNALIAETLSKGSSSGTVVLEGVKIIKRSIYKEKSGAYRAVLVLEMEKKGDEGQHGK